MSSVSANFLQKVWSLSQSVPSTRYDTRVKVDLFVSRGAEHYLDHLKPVFEALPDEIRGELRHDTRGGLSPVVLVAGEKDRSIVRIESPRSRVIRFEHGAGLSYSSEHPAYAGGKFQDNVLAFMSTNRWVNRRWRERYPDIPAPVVGCPKLDFIKDLEPKERDDPPTVVFSFHWDCAVSPESRSAYLEYQRPMIALRDARPDLKILGHCHPRLRHRARGWYEAHGFEFVPTFDEVVRRADLYVVDNSSTLYEFAALDRPVVVINGKTYRRDVHHGLRFWEHSEIGPNVDEPGQLEAAIDEALEDPEPFRKRRRRATREVYPYLGRSTERSVEWITKAVTTSHE